LGVETIFHESFTLETCLESKENSRHIWTRGYVLREHLLPVSQGLSEFSCHSGRKMTGMPRSMSHPSPCWAVSANSMSRYSLSQKDLEQNLERKHFRMCFQDIKSRKVSLRNGYKIFQKPGNLSLRSVRRIGLITMSSIF
jgi:hypothetical protein